MKEENPFELSAGITLPPTRCLCQYFTELAYRLLSSSKTGKRTRNGILIHRKTARLILANGIRIDRNAFCMIISEMVARGLVRNKNQGIYLSESSI